MLVNLKEEITNISGVPFIIRKEKELLDENGNLVMKKKPLTAPVQLIEVQHRTKMDNGKIVFGEDGQPEQEDVIVEKMVEREMIEDGRVVMVDDVPFIEEYRENGDVGLCIQEAIFSVAPQDPKGVLEVYELYCRVAEANDTEAREVELSAEEIEKIKTAVAVKWSAYYAGQIIEKLNKYLTK